MCFCFERKLKIIKNVMAVFSTSTNVDHALITVDEHAVIAKK